MGNILEKAVSPEVLNEAWKFVKNDRAVWQPGMSRAEMEKDFVYHITKLSKDLSEGRYKPAAVRQFPVARGDGKTRIISALTLRDKLAQRAVLIVVTQLWEQLFHADSFGYRPGRTIDMALAKAREYILCGLDWLVDADITKFFDMIPCAPLIKTVKKVIPDKGAVRLIEKWVDVGSPRTGFLRKRRGVPQGGVISPFLCNIYLTEFDQYLTRNNLPFVRFADDFIIFTPSRAAAIAALKCAKDGLKKLDLELNMKKTRVARSGPNVVFLGRKLPKPFKRGLPESPAKR
jgi:RNA-directed DNA polymerase